MTQINSVSSQSSEILTVEMNPQLEVNKLIKVDGILADNTFDQFGKYFIDPVSGLDERNLGRSQLESSKLQKVKLRIAQSAYIYVAKEAGFDLKVDSKTNQPINLHTEDGFQRFYDLTREFIAKKTADLRDQLDKKGVFVPNRDLISGEILPDDSLMLYSALKDQTGKDPLQEADLDKFSTAFQEIVRNYGSTVSVQDLSITMRRTFYQYSPRQTCDLLLLRARQPVIDKINNLLLGTGIAVPDFKSYDNRTEKRFALVPQTIDRAVAYYQSKGFYIPDKDPNIDDAEPYPPGSINRLLLANEIIAGKRPDILAKRQEELKRIEAEQQSQAAVQRQRVRERLLSSQPESSQSTEVANTVTAPEPLGKRLKELFGIYRLADLFSGIKSEIKMRYMFIVGKDDIFFQELEERDLNILSKAGLDPNRTFELWRRGSREDFGHYGEGSTRWRNTEMLRVLERKRPGIAKVLFDEFGIINYRRYPVDVLITQYDQRNDKDLPYGIIANPINDWNGAFLQKVNLFEKLYKKSKGKFYPRIVEVDGKIALAKQLLKLRKRYPERKIAFAIIGGHGTKDSIQFGGNGELYSLYTEDLVGSGTETAGEFFDKGATVVLSSCSTGKEGGIAQKMSERTRLTVIAPDKPTFLKSVTPEIKDGRIYLKAEYGVKEILKQFQQGQSQANLAQSTS